MKTIELIKLKLPEQQFKFANIEDRTCIFDDIRQIYVAISPEEWVRQNFLKYLIIEKKYPAGLISVEAQIKTMSGVKRYDALVCSRDGSPFMLLEFKAPNVRISQDVFSQIGVYNIGIKVKYLVVSNGLKHFCISIDYENNVFHALKNIPEYF